MIQNVVALRVKFRSREISFIVIVHISYYNKKKRQICLYYNNEIFDDNKKEESFPPITTKVTTYVNKRLPGACNRSPGSKLLSITTQLHCGGHLGGIARLPDTILEEDHPMTIPSKFGSN